MFYAYSSKTALTPKPDGSPSEEDYHKFYGYSWRIFRVTLPGIQFYVISLCGGGAGDGWALRRMSGLGASEVAQALGGHPFGTAVEFYMVCTGRIPRIGIPQINTARGHFIEPYTHGHYTDSTGLHPVEIGSAHTFDPEHPWASCSCDGIVPMHESGAIDARTADDTAPPITELKAPRKWIAYIRKYYLIQMIWQMMVTGAPYVDFVQLCQAHEGCPPGRGGLMFDCPIYRVYRNVEVENAVLARASIFVNAVNNAHVDWEGGLRAVQELDATGADFDPGTIDVLPLRRLRGYGELLTPEPEMNKQHFRIDRKVLDTWDDKQRESIRVKDGFTAKKFAGLWGITT